MVFWVLTDAQFVFTHIHMHAYTCGNVLICMQNIYILYYRSITVWNRVLVHNSYPLLSCSLTQDNPRKNPSVRHYIEINPSAKILCGFTGCAIATCDSKDVSRACRWFSTVHTYWTHKQL